MIGIDPKHIIGHWKLNGNFKDYSPNGNDLTPSGTYSWVKNQFGKIALQTPNGSCANISSSPSFVADKEFTIYGWYRTQEIGSNRNYIFTTTPGAFVSGGQILFSYTIGHRLGFNIRKADDSGFVSITTDPFADNNWHFVAGTYKDYGSYQVLTLIKDDEVYQETITTGLYKPSECGIKIAASSGTNNVGEYSNIAYLNKALTVEELQKIRYATQPKLNPKPLYFPEKPVITDGLVGAWGFGSNPLKDASGNGNNGVPNANLTLAKSYIQPKATKYFNTDALANELGIEGTMAKSFSIWFRATATGSVYLCDIRGDSGINGSYVILARDNVYRLGFRGNNTHIMYNTTNTSDGVWHHVVLICPENATTGDVKIYLDGELLTSIYSSDNIAQTLSLGSVHSLKCRTPTSPLIEYRNLMVFNRELSEDEINLIYRTTVPDNSLILDWAGVDRSRYQASQDIYGSAIVGNKFVGNETDAYIDFGNKKQYQIDDEITIQYWYKPKDNSDHVFGDRVGNYEYSEPGYILFSKYQARHSEIRVGDNSNVNRVRATTALEQGAWYLITGTAKVGDKVKIFVNGEKEDETDCTISTFENTSNHLLLGKYGSYYASGEITDVKIYNEVKSEEWIKDYYRTTRALF